MHVELVIEYGCLGQVGQVEGRAQVDLEGRVVLGVDAAPEGPGQGVDEHLGQGLLDPVALVLLEVHCVLQDCLEHPAQRDDEVVVHCGDGLLELLASH